MNELQPERTAEIVGEEIRALTYQVKCMTVLYGVEIGRRLAEAKELVGHGKWLDWLKEETEYSPSTASRLMKVYTEYGAAQLGIFGAEVNSSTLQNLSISNALALLAVPENERESFAEEVGAEGLSVRELEKAIKERDEAIKRAERAEDAANDAAREKDALEEKAREAEQTAAELEAENRELKSRPVEVAVETDEAAVQAAAKQAREEATKEWTQKLEKAERAAEKEKRELSDKLKKTEELLAEKSEEAEQISGDGTAEELAALKAEAESLKKQLALSGAELTAFRLLFDGWQESFNRMLEALAKVPEDSRDKLRGAVKAVLEQQGERL